MFKRILINMVAIGCFTSLPAFAQQSLFGDQSSTKPQQQQQPNITPPLSPSDFKTSKQGVTPLAQQNLDNLNKQLSTILTQQPPPTVPPPPKISDSNSTQNTPPTPPEAIQIPSDQSQGGTSNQTGTQQPSTATNPNQPQQPQLPPPSQNTETKTPSQNSGSSGSQTYTGFQGMNPNVKSGTGTGQGSTPSGGFNIKY